MKNYNNSDTETNMCCTAPQPLLIRDMPVDDRPREKALKFGMKSLSNSELMALIFATGIKGKSVTDLCNDILRDNDNHLSKIAIMTVSEMTSRYKGIGPAKAISMLAALELGARSAADAASINDAPIQSADSAYNIMRHHFERLDHEEFWVLLLSQSCRPLRQVKIGQGGITSTVVDVRQIVRSALECRATGILLFHNHPSGNLTPSQQDKDLTVKVNNAAKLFDMRVMDHIIITDGSYYSFQANGLL